MIFNLWKFHIICNVSNIIVYCFIDDSTQKSETKRRENLLKYIGNIIEKVYVYICKSVTVWVRLPNTSKKNYVKTLIWSVHWSFKEKQTLRDITLRNERKAANFKIIKFMSQIVHGIECTPVTDASLSISKTSTRYAFTPFFFCLLSIFNLVKFLNLVI